MAYVLILMLSAYGSDGGNALTAVRFENQPACEAAGKEAQAMTPTVGPSAKRLAYRCMPAN
jgi:hypothetical protein